MPNLDYKRKIKTLGELKEIIISLQAHGMKVVWTNGCFDLLHIGHASYLSKAKQKGDILIVGVNSDSSVRQLKGEGRPVRPERARAELISALESVDYVVIFPDLNTSSILAFLQPDLFVKADDYSLEKLNPSERKAVENYGGKIEFIPIEENISTTKIITQIKSG